MTKVCLKFNNVHQYSRGHQVQAIPRHALRAQSADGCCSVDCTGPANAYIINDTSWSQAKHYTKAIKSLKRQHDVYTINYVIYLSLKIEELQQGAQQMKWYCVAHSCESESFAKSVSAIFKKVEVQLSAVISLVVNSESLVRVPRTNDSDTHDTRTILRLILRLTYDFHGFIRVTRTSLSDVCHHLYTVYISIRFMIETL